MAARCLLWRELMKTWLVVGRTQVDGHSHCGRLLTFRWEARLINAPGGPGQLINAPGGPGQLLSLPMQACL